MDEHLKARLEKIRKFTDSAKRRATLYSDLGKFDDKKTAQSLGSLNRAPNPGGKLKKIGFIMCWIPEPTGVTCAVGGPMIIAGKYLDRVYNPSKITDIGNHTNDTFSSMKDFKNTLF